MDVRNVPCRASRSRSPCPAGRQSDPHFDLRPTLILPVLVLAAAACSEPVGIGAHCEALLDRIRFPGTYSQTRPDVVQERAFREFEAECTGRPRPDTARGNRDSRTREDDDRDRGPGGRDGFDNR